LIVAAPYIAGAAGVTVTQMVCRRVRRWDRETTGRPFDWQADPQTVKALSDESLTEARDMAFASVGAAFQRGSTRLPELFSPLSRVDREVQQKLWPNVIPLREVMSPSTKNAPGA
jgi:hypothetical protein